MMGIEAIHAVRWALYLVLGILSGATFFAQFLARPRVAPMRKVTLGLLALAGLTLSLCGFALSIAAMSGTSVADTDPELLRTMILTTAVGWAFIAQSASLLAILLLVALPGASRTGRLEAIPAFGAIAIGAIAWSGHAAASEGTNSAARLAGDIVHMLAASLWLGALVVLLRELTRQRTHSADSLQDVWALFYGFGRIGSVVVTTLVITGILNMAFLFNVADLAALPFQPYGRWLLIKLGLFSLMVALAGINRFYLTPRRVGASGSGRMSSLRILRLTVTLELALIIAIMGIVGWIGTQEPIMTQSL